MADHTTSGSGVTVMTGGIIRVEKPDRYSIIANSVILDSRLTFEARGVLIYLLTKPNNWTVRREDLIRQSPAGETVIRRVLKELREFGYLRRIRRADADGKIEWETTVYESPTLNPDAIVIIDFLSTIGLFPTSGSSTCGEQRHIVITESIKTDSIIEKQQKEEGQEKEILPALLPESPEERLLFQKLTTEQQATGSQPELRFPRPIIKTKFNKAADRLGPALESAIDCALGRCDLTVTDLVNYIARWRPAVELEKPKPTSAGAPSPAKRQPGRLAHEVATLAAAVAEIPPSSPSSPVEPESPATLAWQAIMEACHLSPAVITARLATAEVIGLAEGVLVIRPDEASRGWFDGPIGQRLKLTGRRLAEPLEVEFLTGDQLTLTVSVEALADVA